ncbi:Homoserine/homoserine lactone efflux protein [Nocardioides dokdonensis FR1436]|uniref:Homoserine/homoserine lactone efflux protein n=1 Tax=Nocardioides dokdonensis FR1436 TaxID=1300347 RepID=A0A1A9GJU8_9ACTN|nr:LysE family translocator [Nocardioides dokdonensis]ANH38534.1 Homoserine/homoserine lactone efflux protein [Nocardioides dokdonensis FR1436]
MLTAVLAFSLAGALLVVLPGPDTLVVIRGMVRGGRRRAVWTALGGLTGLVVWVSITALGLAALLHASHAAYLALKIAGAAYLVWLGVQAFRSRTGDVPVEAPVTAASGPGPRERRTSGFGAGLATNLLNPKIGVMFVALLPGFVPSGASVATTSMLLGGIYITETAVYVAVLIALSGPVVRWMAEPRIRRRLDRLMGTVFVAFGVQLAVKP